MKERLREITPRPIWAAGRAVRDAGRRVGYVRARWPRPLGTRPPIRLAICAIFRDEARYLPEWVSFHRLQGVERFYLYDNRSNDDWRSALEPEISAGIVEVQHWPFSPGQGSAYEDCLRRNREEARWIAFIDVDEFLFSPTGRRLSEVLRDFDAYPGVVVNWRMYGTSGWEQPPDGLVIENFVWRSGDDHQVNRYVKSIVYPRQALGWVSPHYFRLRGNPVGEDGRPVVSPAREPTADLLRINHYYARSEEDFRRKASRAAADTGDVTVDRIAVPADEVRDEVILQFAAGTRKMMRNRAELAGGAERG